jgi:hypothetical protein
MVMAKIAVRASAMPIVISPFPFERAVSLADYRKMAALPQLATGSPLWHCRHRRFFSYDFQGRDLGWPMF